MGREHMDIGILLRGFDVHVIICFNWFSRVGDFWTKL